MKKTFYLTAILITGCIANMFGQGLILTFTAQNNSQHVPLDSILIMNLTQGGDTTIYDTVFNWINVSNIQSICHQTACSRTPAWSDRNVPTFCIVNKIPHNKKIG